MGDNHNDNNNVIKYYTKQDSHFKNMVAERKAQKLSINKVIIKKRDIKKTHITREEFEALQRKENINLTQEEAYQKHRYQHWYYKKCQYVNDDFNFNF